MIMQGAQALKTSQDAYSEVDRIDQTWMLIVVALDIWHATTSRHHKLQMCDMNLREHWTEVSLEMGERVFEKAKFEDNRAKLRGHEASLCESRAQHEALVQL